MTARRLHLHAAGIRLEREDLITFAGDAIATHYSGRPRRLHIHAARTARKRRATADPRHPSVRFAEDVLGIELAPWQIRWLELSNPKEPK